ncbi:uncharacterized protein LOC108906310 isoform X1 [Anoplophora glabripennis]|uniref:uncharacterized protein LOC108906310 isoform X1 n=2 Tax=Anoplophora glabripennis TaxID=217634 RepID=UPI0008749206|nr:uncharacterized protein LOC108906310 isoform X1 [Anoplophora glabripennis]
MKTLFVFLCVAILGALAHHLPETEMRKLKEVHDSCQANPTTHVDEKLLKKLKENVEDKKVGTHLLCMAVKVGLLTQDGDLMKNVIRDKIVIATHDVSKVDEVLKKCAVKRETPEKTAIQMLVCFIDNGVHYHHNL